MSRSRDPRSGRQQGTESERERKIIEETTRGRRYLDKPGGETQQGIAKPKVLERSDVNVMIVDDATISRVILKHMLVRNGFSVAGEAENGTKAVQLYMSLKPHVVLLDVTMPDISGIEVAKKIVDFDSDACIVMCSAMGQQPVILDSMRAGALDFIVKPILEERVVEAIQNALGIS